MRQTVFTMMALALGMVLTVTKIQAQESTTISGTIKSDLSKVGVMVFGKESTQIYYTDKLGEFSFKVNPYQEYVVSFFGKNLAPLTISAFTKGARQISFNGTLKNPVSQSSKLGPIQRLTKRGKSKFDLDKVKDKSSVGVLTAKAIRSLTVFYKTGALPKVKSSKSESAKKVDLTNRLQELKERARILVGRKSALTSRYEQALQKLPPDFRATNNEEASAHCKQQLMVLIKKASAMRSTMDLQGMLLEIKRVESKLSSNSNDGTKTLQQTFKAAQTAFNIARRESLIKKTDCWEMEMKGKLEAGSDKEKQAINAVKAADIGMVRYKERQDNARELYQSYNQLAMDEKERGRLEALAQAQYYIWQRTQAHLEYSKLALSKVRAENVLGKSSDSGKDLQSTIDRLEVDAYNAEFGYLEHMWHLRQDPDLSVGVADLFRVQTDLLSPVEIVRKPKAPLAAIVPPKQNPIPEPQPQQQPHPEVPPEEIKPEPTNEEVLAQIEFGDASNEDGDGVKITYGKDSYYMLRSKAGAITYRKNDKPITRLTYQFETKRVFGEILKDVRSEERKGRFLKLFRARSALK